MEIDVKRLVPKKVLDKLAKERLEALAELLSPRDPREAKVVVSRARRQRILDTIDRASVIDRARIQQLDRERRRCERDRKACLIERILAPSRAAQLVRRYVDIHILHLTPYERRLLRKNVSY